MNQFYKKTTHTKQTTSNNYNKTSTDNFDYRKNASKQNYILKEYTPRKNYNPPKHYSREVYLAKNKNRAKNFYGKNKRFQNKNQFFRRKKRFYFVQSHVFWNQYNWVRFYPYLKKKFYFGFVWSRNTKLSKFGPINLLMLKKNWKEIWPIIYRRYFQSRLYQKFLKRLRPEFLKYSWKVKIWKKSGQGYQKKLKYPTSKIKNRKKNKLKKIYKKKIKKIIKIKKWIRVKRPFYFSQLNYFRPINYFFKFKRKISIFKTLVKKKPSYFWKYFYFKGKKRLHLKRWIRLPQKGYKLKWRKILRRLNWRFNKMFKLKKKEYFLRVWKRHIKKRFHLLDKHLKYKSFEAHRSFFTNRLIQIIHRTKGIKYFKQGKHAVLGGRVRIEHAAVKDVNYIVKPFETIFLNLDTEYLNYRMQHRQRKKNQKKNPRKRFYVTDGFFYNPAGKTFMCWKYCNDKTTFRIDYLSNYYNYKLLSMWN